MEINQVVRRLERLQLLKSLWQIGQLASQKSMYKDLQKETEKAADFLEKAAKENAEFSASRWALQTNI